MSGKMVYRDIGRTGMKAGVIGLGTEHIDGKPFEVVDSVINTAVDNGINMIDLFMPGEEVRTHIGKALGNRRKDVMIQGHICSTDINEQYDRSRDLPTVKKYFENLLRCLKTDYIDFGMLFFIDSENDYSDVFGSGGRGKSETEILRYAEDLKKSGVIRAIGASSHNPKTAKRVVESGVVDLLMFSINPAFDMARADIDVLEYLGDKKMDFDKALDQDRAALYRLCLERGVAITVMKTLGAGKLIDPDFSPFGAPLSVNQCIHYALTRPAVVSVMLGASTKEQVLQSLEYLDASDAEKDYSAVVGKYKGSFAGKCVYCNHCLPCPAGINIAEVNKAFDAASLNTADISASVKNAYTALKAHASDCTGCQSCESRCPFAVPVSQNMKKASALFHL